VSAVSADDQRRFFFIHLMKTGGTSFVMHLLANFAPVETYPSELDKRDVADGEPYASIADLLALSPRRRAEIRFYAGHFPYMVRSALGVDVVAITLLREPVARTISVLNHFKRLNARYRDSSLEEIYDDEFVFRHFVENFQTRSFALTSDDCPQSFASAVGYRDIRAALDRPASMPMPAVHRGDTIAIDEPRLARAKSNLAEVDVVGVSDRFTEFVQELRRRFGWWPDDLDTSVRANVSSEGWDAGPELRRRIAQDNAFDAELYEFASELAARRRV
jgi:hypothetical protein